MGLIGTIGGGGGGGTYSPPIPQSDVTSLVSDLAAKQAAATAATDAELAAEVATLNSSLAGKAASSHSHAEADVTGLVADLALKAPLASPTLTGTPAAPTASGGTNTTQLATTAFVQAAINALSLAATYQPLDADLTSIAGLTTTSFGRSLLELADAAAGRSALGLVIGTNVQAYDADLTTLGALGSGARSALGLAIGTDVQAYDADLTTLGALGSGARSALGLAIGTDVQAYSSVPYHAPKLLIAQASAALTANISYYVGVWIPCPCTLTGIWLWANTLNGTIRSSIYNSSGTRVANRTTNFTVVANLNQIPFDSTYAVTTPGLYFLSVTMAGTVLTSQNSVFTTPSGNVAGPGSGATATSITPPTVPSATRVPTMGTY